MKKNNDLMPYNDINAIETFLNEKIAIQFGDTISKYKATANLFSKYTVKNDRTLKAIVELMGKTRSLKRDIDERHSVIVAPFNQYRKIANGITRGLKSQCEEILFSMEKLIKPYLDQKELERQEKTKQAIARQEDLYKEYSDGEATPVIIPEIIPDQIKISTPSGSLTIKEKLTPEIADLLKAVSNADFVRARSKYLEEQVLIYARQCIKFGNLNIPGVIVKKENVPQGYTR